MAKQDKYQLPLGTVITMTASKGDLCYIKNVTFEEALTVAETNRGTNGWTYKNYQLGYCAMKEKHK